jgi:hypothetical protein
MSLTDVSPTDFSWISVPRTMHNGASNILELVILGELSRGRYNKDIQIYSMEQQHYRDERGRNKFRKKISESKEHFCRGTRCHCSFLFRGIKMMGVILVKKCG